MDSKRVLKYIKMCITFTVKAIDWTKKKIQMKNKIKTKNHLKLIFSFVAKRVSKKEMIF